MLLHNRILYIEHKDLVAAGKSNEHIWKAVSTKVKAIAACKIPELGAGNYFKWEDMANGWRECIEKRFGNPFDFVAREPIMKMVVLDHKAEEFYLQYRYAENKALPIKTVRKYTRAACWLNMLKDLQKNRQIIKKTLCLTIPQFYEHCGELIKLEKVNGKNEKYTGGDQLSGDFPSTYQRLLNKVELYSEKGYEFLIDEMYGNQIASKVNDEVAESLLIEMLCHPNQFDDYIICNQYNKWAKENDKKTISPQTVGNKRRENEALIIMSREGNAALHGKFLKQAKGFRPTTPTLMWESDDNHLDLLFEDPNDTTAHRYYHKYKAIVVTDSFNDLVLGYAYAEELSTELVKAAYVNAMYYLKSITGYWVLPYETKSDRWAVSQLQPFYEQMGNYFKTPVGSKNRGYIENFFGSSHWKNCLKIGANNYTGNNLSARTAGVNREALELNKKNRPLIGSSADLQVENFFNRLRNMPQSNGMSKQEQWLAAWQLLDIDKKKIISDEQFLLKFGIVHQPQGRAISITNRGCEPVINGIEYSYDLPANIRTIDYVGCKVNVVYDPFDMSRVLLTNFDNIRIVAKDARLNSRALEDGNAGSRTYLNSILAEKTYDVNRISVTQDNRKKILIDNNITAEAILQAGVMDKTLKQAAEMQYILPANKSVATDNDNTPFNIYADILNR
ncbi:MAG: hypothetical protein NTZ59_11485 [Bacteroidetes bacterium]|nr:hypothetical protein [Bacteroidota bacterium]